LLPPAIRVEGIHVDVFLRGPVAVVRATVALRNAGEDRWRGALSVGDALLPPPLASAGGQDVNLGPGARTEVVLVALCALRNRSDHYGMGLNPAVWAEEVGAVSVTVDADADGGIREFLAPTLRPDERRPGHVTFAETCTDAAGLRPIVLEMRLEEEGVDAVQLVGAGGPRTVSALRLDVQDQPWVSRDRKIFLAFDATGDFGPGGRVAAHEVLEGLIGALPPGATTALIAFDGNLKFDADKLMLHLPVRAEAMLDRLWQLDPPGGQGGRTAQFLAAALVPITGLDAESLTVLVTGRGEPGDLAACRELLSEGRTRLVVLQVGTAHVSPGYRDLCAETGGVALGIPPAMAPELGVIDFLANLSEPAISSVRFGAEGSRGARSLLGPGDFANQPVVVLSGPSGANEVATALVGEDELGLPLGGRGESVPALGPAEADGLCAALEGAPAE
jgi:hypothetical protein